MKSIRLCMAASVAAAFVMTILAAPSAQGQTYKEKVLYAFQGTPDGAHPQAGVIQDSKGNFYGTTLQGGAYSGGTAFKVSETGNETVQYSFCAKAYCTDGQDPWAGLAVIRDARGNLYGTTIEGGAYSGQGSGYSNGTVFKVSETGKETVLYSFCPGGGGTCTDGNAPVAGLIEDANGNFYGTTEEGGTPGNGTVFRLSKTGKETVLYNFCSKSNCADGATPYAGVIQDAGGNLYGTTSAGGAYNDGTAFKVSKTGIETVLHSFCTDLHCTDGSQPSAGLIQDAEGNLYGTTLTGGRPLFGGGVVFKLSKTGGFKVLHRFTGGADGGGPEGGVILDSKGNLYGTTAYGGCGDCGPYGYGVVFKLDKTGKETVLYTFTGKNDGGNPYAGVIQDGKGNLYGTTKYGGDASCDDSGSGCGVVFKLTP